MKISVITWDASFREKFHAIHSFCTQKFPQDEFEFIWVDFYSNKNKELIETLNTYPNAKLLNLENPNEVPWHLGKCINAGVKISTGDILVFPDGDIIVDEDHLSTIAEEIETQENLVLYFRRFDELHKSHCEQSYKLNYLEQHTQLINPTNYAGCFAISKAAYWTINGYEENEVFAGPGANAMETYFRIRNAGFAIKWHDKKIYHPWHSSSGSSDKETTELRDISKRIKWLRPYCGIRQSWVLKNREISLSFSANNGEVERFLTNAPTIKDLRPISFLRKIKNKLL